MRAVDLIRQKRDGGALDTGAIQAFVDGATDGSWPDYQVAALLMAIVVRGMSLDESIALTDAMVRSGQRLDLSEFGGVAVDKHSTGGVGDQTSLILAPLAAACGVVVPMMSGRGLGHTGGTLDKLEAIPGFRTNLTLAEMRRVLRQTGCVLIGQTDEIAPADRKLYALRDVTATVESRPLICASILSKKIAEGIGGLVLDVKVGRGAFMKTREDARALASWLIRIAEGNGVRTEALLTSMDAPLGRAVGNASEVIEAIETLKGRGPKDLEDLSVALAARLLMLASVAADDADAERQVRGALASGAGLEKFRDVILAQGGDPRVVDDYARMPKADTEIIWPADRDGVVARLDAELIGRATVALGAGRDRADAAIDPGVGIDVEAIVGTPVKRGDAVLRLRCDDRQRVAAARQLLAQAVEIGDAAPAPAAVIVERMDAAAAARMEGVMARLQPLVGLVLIALIAYSLSTNRRAIRGRTIAWGFGLQFLFALIVLKTAAGQETFAFLGEQIRKLLGFASVGSSFVFGPIGNQPVWARIMNNVLGPEGAQYGVIFAFQIAPTIIFIAALFAILYYFGIMQLVVRLFALVMNRVMGASGAESLNVAASIFMGQTEAPLTIRPYLPRMTQSELMTVMTSGMAHISGGIMAAYIAFGIEPKHLLTAVIMTAPGTLMMAKMFVPETETPETLGSVKLAVPRTDVNVIDAAGRGTGEGLHLAMNVIAMLISFIALIALVNAIMGGIGGWFGYPQFSLQMVLGWVFAPIAWSLGVPWRDAGVIGNLLGTRMVLNEFIAFAQLGPMKDSLDPRSFTVATFALCGFANFASIGIQIGGIGALVPERRHDLARLGMRAMLAGTLANFVSACIAALLL